VSKEVIYKRP